MGEDKRPRGAIVEITLASLLLVLSSCVPRTQRGLDPNVTSVRSIGDTGLLPSRTRILPTPAFTLEPGKGAVIGKVDLGQVPWEEVKVFLAPFYEVGEGGEGFYVLEPSVHPQGTLEPGGSFEIADIEPGYYVILLGPDPTEASALQADAQPRILRVLAGGVLNVGEIRYPLQ